MPDRNFKSEVNKLAELSWFTRSTRKYTPQIAELMVIAAVLRLIGLVQPFVFQTLVDRVLPFQRMASLDLILFVLVGATVFSAALSAISTLLGAQVANRLTGEMGRRIYDHVLHLPLALLQRFHVGATLARVREIDTVREFLTGTIATLVLDALFAIIYVAALLALSPSLTLVVLVMLPLQLICFGLVGPFLRARLQENFHAGSRHQSRTVEAFGNAVSIKALSAEELQTERVSQTLQGTLFAGYRVTKMHVVNGVVGDLLGGLSVILIIYFGTLLVFAGELTLGQLLAFHLIAEKVSGPIMSLSTVWEKWQGLRIARLRLGDFLNASSEDLPPRPKLPQTSMVPLAVENLSFAYGDDDKVFEDLSLAMQPGEITVIVGDSGCGKSTLAKLLAGLYVPDTGRVMFADQDISKHDPSSVRQRIAYVPQEPVLFAGTIRDNMYLAKEDATDIEIMSALSTSASANFVERSAAGLDTEVGERGGFLSGGQRQRIAIARSLLTEPEVLVLDEPTSSLDEVAATAVMQSLAELSSTKTVIVITHRPDLVSGRKRLIDLDKAVLSHGRAEAAGSND